MTTPHVYTAISEVTAKLAEQGISKDHKNQQQGYKFRGIDDVYNALSPMLAAAGLNILPRFIERELVERVTQKGGALFYVTVKGEFDFVSAQDGSKHTVVTYGEAMDSADKATNKAMSAAYKYAAFQAFCIPTEGDNDADATTHEVKPVVQHTTKPVAKPTKKEASPMPDHEYEAYRMDIGAAGSLAELKETFTAAYKKAEEYGDKPAMDGFTKIKDTRKQELEAPKS